MMRLSAAAFTTGATNERTCNNSPENSTRIPAEFCAAPRSAKRIIKLIK